MGSEASQKSESNRFQELHQRLREAIITGEFRPNERLVEADLAELLSVSRTPVRECLQRLVAEGLVRRVRRGWVVHEHTPEEIREIYDVRAGLEGWAVRLGTMRATDEELKVVRSVHDEAARLDVKELRARAVELTRSFHDHILATCKNQRLLALIQQSREYYFNTRLAGTYTDEELLESIRGQQAIVDAMLARDAERTERLMREHIEEARDTMLSKPM
ncbi:GntR family transcriptional regulator [Actinomadura sp. B10D3]|uniref:GntR family transcriptional regulator n=1 Tax=Actinomadura sp. B10D3 TaxID=3153557 RepID=UPI00325C5C0A